MLLNEKIKIINLMLSIERLGSRNAVLFRNIRRRMWKGFSSLVKNKSGIVIIDQDANMIEHDD